MDKSIVRIKFGNQVRRFRREHGWSQEELADRCALDRTYISGIERGVRNPTLEIIIGICLALRVAPSILFDWDGEVFDGDKR